ncbi:uncharacterized protein [Nicotiana tomentosiformis]|uniref:uncharacterized protein n=1 Tax=Nicotiana tomentosiformis TaxID=4098 RepID=UPI00388CE872
MKDDESIHEMHTRFTFIINELHSLGEIIPRNNLVRKILNVLHGSWESKVNVITEAKDLQKLTIDELIVNLKTYEIKKNKDNERIDPKRENNLVLKTYKNDTSGEDADMAYLTKRFQKMVRRNGGLPLLKQYQYKHNTDKATKRNPIPNKRFKRKDVTHNVVKQALAAWGNSSSESGEDDEQSDRSMIAVKSEAVKYDYIFALMVKSNDDEYEVNFLDSQRNLKSYSQKRHISLANIVIDAYHNLIKDKNALIVELGEVEHERDDLLVVVVDLKETTMKLKRGGRHEINQKGKGVASEAHIKLENELQTVKSIMCVELERNRQLQEDLGRVKSDLEKSLKWTWSSNAIAAMYTSNGGNMQGVGFQRKRLPTTHIASMLLFLITGFVLTMATPVTLKKIVRLEFSPNRKIRCLLKRYKNIYVADFESLQNGDLSCLSDVDDDAELWHKRLGHASFTLLNKLVKKDLVCGLPKSSLKDHKVKMSHNVVCIRSDHDTEFDNAKLDEFCAENGITQAINTTCYLVNKCMIRSLLNKTPYELLNGRKSKVTHLRTFGCKYFDLNNGKEALEEFGAKSDEGIFLGYSSQSKAYKVEQSVVPGEVIDMANGKPDLMSQVKESNDDGVYVSNWKHKSSHPLENVIYPLNSGIQTRSKSRNALAFSSFLSQIEPKNIKEALKDDDWITAMQKDLNQFERNNTWHLDPRPSDRTVIGTKWVFKNKLDEVRNTTRNKARLVVQGYNQEEVIDYDETFAQLLEWRPSEPLLHLLLIWNSNCSKWMSKVHY